MSAIVDPKVHIDGEPTPFVLSLARTLRESQKHAELADLFSEAKGTLALRTGDGQIATLRFLDGEARLQHGVADGADAIGLATGPEYTLTDESTPIASSVARLLRPPLPYWRNAAASFWAVNHSDPGFPTRLAVVCTDDDDQVVFGEGSDSYEIHGSATALSEVLSGRGESFLLAVASGLITVVGGVSQLSVMCGAHWKVRFDG